MALHSLAWQQTGPWEKCSMFLMYGIVILEEITIKNRSQECVSAGGSVVIVPLIYGDISRG